MLAANTIGPGTVITCARAGAEQGLQLMWTLVFATVLAYTLQVSLGQSWQLHFAHWMLSGDRRGQHDSP